MLLTFVFVGNLKVHVFLFVVGRERERERGLLITYHEVALILIDKTVSEQILLEVQTNGVGSTLEFKFPREIGEVTF